MKVLLPSTAEKDLAKFALSLQQLASGRSNATGTVTLATGASSTVVSAVNCSPTSAVFLFPTTADAVPALTVKIQKFTTVGASTYTPSAGMVYCIIECVGGGGAGGGAALTAANTQNGAGGGGGGGYSRLIATAATIVVSKAVTIGAGGASPTAGNNPGGNGGDSSVGTICIAKGGTGGLGAVSGGSNFGGAGGVAGTGDFSVPGQSGGSGYPASSTAVFPQTGGSGGNAALGFGGGAIGTSAQTNGNAGSLYGGGGSGGTDFNATAAKSGGAGAAGIVIITEYCFAGAASPTFISSVGKQTFTISHENSAVADRTFFYLCLG